MFRLFDTSSPPTSTIQPAVPYTKGLEFTVSQACWVREIHFWQPTTGSSAATRTAALYSTTDGLSGTLLASTTLPVVGVGWQTAVLDGQIAVVPGTVYRACVLHPDGQMAVTNNYWSTGAGAAGVTSGPLSAPRSADALLTFQNSYIEGATLAFPSQGFLATNWWTDVTVDDAAESTRNALAVPRMRSLARGGM